MLGRSFNARRCFSRPGSVTFEFLLQDSHRSLPAFYVQVDLVRDRTYDEKLEMLIEKAQVEGSARWSDACYQLGAKGDLRAVDSLLTMFHQSADARFRTKIVWALEHLGSVDAIPTLIDALQDARVWVPAYSALEGITGHDIGQDWRHPGLPGFQDEAIRKWRMWFAENEIALRSRLHQNRAD
jgi:HEAT repeat protein